MKRTQKKILGFLGLFVVGVTTIFAAMLPGPEASALSTLTDTITVTVVGSSPLVDVREPENGMVSSEADQILRYHYQNVNKIKITIVRTDKDDVEQPPVVYEYNTDTEVGDGEYSLNLNSPELGYGKYVVMVQGYKEGEGIPDEGIVEFEFLPAIVDLKPDEETGDATVELDFDEDNNDIDHFEIVIADGDGNPIDGIPPITVTPPDTTVTIPFSEYGLPEGEYVIETTAYGGDTGNEPLYKSYDSFYNYTPAPEPAPKVQIVEPTNGAITSDAEQNITIDHEDVTKLTITIKRTDKDGVEHTKIVEVDTALEPGTTSLPYNLNDQTDPDFGYGVYTITVVGTNAGEVVSEQSISFEFLPVTVDTTRDPETGDADVTLDYDEDNNGIDHFVIIIKDSDGNPIDGIPPIIVTPPETKLTIPFSKYGLPEGKYIIETTAYDADGNALYTPYNTVFKYTLEPEPEHEDIPVPNTGGFLKNLNISRTDYLVTGLIIFFTFGIGGLVFVIRGRNSDGRNRKR